jgi:hypothetical protein
VLDRYRRQQLAGELVPSDGKDELPARRLLGSIRPAHGLTARSRLYPPDKAVPRRIDGAVAAAMTVHRAAELAGAPRLDIYL